MKIIGLILILLSLVATAWWVCTDHLYKPEAFLIGLIAIFTGVYFTVQDRAIEISIKNVGTIKAAAQQATEDAEEISDIKNRIQNQSATIDLIAESSSKAHKLVEDAKTEILEIKQQVNETVELASPPTLNLTGREIKEVNSQFIYTLQFTPSKNEPLGTIQFVIGILDEPNAKILNIWPSLKGGAFSTGDNSKYISPDGQKAQLTYSLISNGNPTIDLTLTVKTSIVIMGNYNKDPILFNPDG